MFELNRIEQLHQEEMDRRETLSVVLRVSPDQKTALVLGGGGSATNAIQHLIDGILPPDHLTRSRISIASVRSILTSAISDALLKLFQAEGVSSDRPEGLDAASPAEQVEPYAIAELSDRPARPPWR